jgi:hypothetical protein
MRALECLRLAAESMQLASDVPSPDLQSHFLRMGKQWTILADQEACEDTRPQH